MADDPKGSWESKEDLEYYRKNTYESLRDLFDKLEAQRRMRNWRNSDFNPQYPDEE